MTPEKIASVIHEYRKLLEQHGIPKIRMSPRRTFESLSKSERLAHAHFLLDGVLEYAADPKKYDKANRHLTAIQMCLSFAGWYTLEELMDHNRPDTVHYVYGGVAMCRFSMEAPAHWPPGHSFTLEKMSITCHECRRLHDTVSPPVFYDEMSATPDHVRPQLASDIYESHCPNAGC